VSARSARFRWTWWPRSLFGRIALVLFCGLAAAHILTLTLLLRERSETMGAMMMAYLAKDVASSVAILDRLPAAERPSWLPKIERRNYRYILGNPSPGRPADSPDAREISGVISRALDGPHDISISMSPGASDPLQLAIHLKLKDGAPLTIEPKWVAPPLRSMPCSVVLPIIWPNAYAFSRRFPTISRVQLRVCDCVPTFWTTRS
jgi:hypothetical protein